MVATGQFYDVTNSSGFGTFTAYTGCTPALSCPPRHDCERKHLLGVRSGHVQRWRQRDAVLTLQLWDCFCGLERIELRFMRPWLSGKCHWHAGLLALPGEHVHELHGRVRDVPSL
jgi:hypothetical protein